jgi:outer membrane protein assembly factor BamC
VTLEVPPDLNQLSRDTLHRAWLQRLGPRAAGRPGQVTPPLEKAAALTVGDVTIERDGNQRWLVVDRPADKLWDPVRDFWLENGFNMAIEKPELGILETDWAENRAKLPQDIIRSTLGKVFDSLYSTSERDRSAPAWNAAPMARPKSTSPTAACRRSTPASKDNTIWQPRAADPELETEFLRRIMVKLGSTKSSPRPWSPRAAPSHRGQSARVTTLNGQPAVEIDEGFDRAWRRVWRGAGPHRLHRGRPRPQQGPVLRALRGQPRHGRRRRASSAACSAQGRSQARQVPDRRAQRRRQVSAVVLGDNGQPESDVNAQRIVRVIADDLK